MSKEQSIGEIFTIQVSHDEAEQIINFLEDNEYSKNNDGLKDFIMDIVSEDFEDENEYESPLHNFANQKPEITQEGLLNIAKMGYNVFKRFKK